MTRSNVLPTLFILASVTLGTTACVAADAEDSPTEETGTTEQATGPAVGRMDPPRQVVFSAPSSIGVPNRGTLVRGPQPDPWQGGGETSEGPQPDPWRPATASGPDPSKP